MARVIACLALSFGIVIGALCKAHPALGAAPAETRVALVIGNAAYPQSALKNPVNDARAMALSLRALGFETIVRENATYRDMRRAVGEFGRRIAGGGVGLFYFAGHGMQIRGRNYLMPVDADIGAEAEVALEALDLATVLEQMAAAGNRVNIAILDACRNNPFERRFRATGGGLATVDAPKGTMIAFATAPGKVAADGAGENGLYTSELLKAMRLPGRKLEDVFKQVRVEVTRKTRDEQTPWETSSLTGDFYFSPAAGDPAGAATKTPPAGAVDDGAIELAFWNAIKDSRGAGDYREFLKQFPQGRFAGLAKNRLASLDTAAASPPAQVAAAPARATEGLARFDGVWRGNTFTCIVGTPNPVEVTIANGVMKGTYERVLGPPRELTGAVDAQGKVKGTGIDAEFEGEIRDDKLTGTFDAFNIPVIKQCRSSFMLTRK